jgi:acetylornithine deacetylase/succinyl-diaminopimelate desuccinylase-like protein
MTTATTAVQDAIDFLRDRDDDHLTQLDAFLRIPSVSADAERRGDVRRAAEWVADELRRIGVGDVALQETGGHPMVTGAWLGAGPAAPTVLVYCHYDVQPADPLEQWIRPPFEPRFEDGRCYARGAADDKGQLFMHLKAAEAYLAGAGGGLPVNLRFLFEGEEEIGSEHFASFLESHAAELTADIVIVSDTGFFDRDVPSISYGLRGIAYLEVTVRGPSQDLHSGGYGGAVANPANVLVEMLASLHDERGRVTVPGFYDHVRPLEPDERASLAALPFDEERWRAETGIPAPAGEAGYSTLERKTVRPTLDINGIWGGYTGEGAKTIIPAAASAKLSCRLVPGQDDRQIAELVRSHLERIAPPTVRVKARVIHTGAASVTPLRHPAVQAAARALEATFGRSPVFERSGGSIPAVAALDAILGLKSVLVGFALPDCNAHSPNEWLDLSNYRRGMETLVRLWAELGALTPEELRRAMVGG